MYRSRPHRRHGVLLLIVLCVLFMFLLLAITYAVVASKERAVTRNQARFERSGDPPNVVLDQIFMMLARDTNDARSPFRGQSLEEGIWGNVSFRGTVGGTPTPQAGGQFLQFTPSVSNFNSTPNYYKGCVLTMLTGQCAALSTRIVASTGTSVTVMRFQADAGLYDPASGDTFLINGRAYCGMGRGYNTSPANATDPANNAMDPNNWPYALLPNPFGFQGTATYGSDPSGPGGANMDYTACDYNNCYLGLMLNGPVGQSGAGIIPSFFRPALYTYWANQPGNLTSNATLLRKISFRPNLVDNPYFCQNTNPGYAPGSPTSTFDVDNLGGGIPDSIWIDPGLPVVTMRDGRTAKILVATCILDLDGRINVNAHGSVLNADTNVYPTAGTGAEVINNGVAINTAGTWNAAIAGLAVSGSAYVPVGQGYGPPDISLNGIFSPAEVKNLIYGVGPTSTAPQTAVSPVGWPGRYGGSPGSASSPSSVTNAALEWVKLFELPIGGTDDPRLLLTSFGTPPDLKGRRLLVLDPRGQPNFFTPGSNPANGSYWTYEVNQNSRGTTTTAESPYAFKFDRSVPRPGRTMAPTIGTPDNPFTVGELEPILRQYDVDIRSLPQRLYSLLPSVLTNPNQRNRLTTESWDLPAPNFQAPRNLRAALSGNGYRAYGITDLLNAKLQGTGVAGNSNAEIAKLLPPELIAGLRMDINRPFGNGRDDNGNGLVNEPGGILSPNSLNRNYIAGPADASPESEKTLASVSSTSGYSVAVPFNLVNGSGTNGADPVLSSNLPAGVQARQLMARHLYALMMLFADQTSYNWTVETGLSAAQQQQLTARRIAQWAINAVSFRDSTSIMTPFMYQWDIYQSTYQGWTVDGDPGNTSQATQNYGVVWACKPPDAVLTETAAFHDKRIADTSWDSGNNGMTTSTPPDAGGGVPTPPGKMPPAGNFDQTRIPQGSTFIEINCTRNPNTPFAPTDLYVNVGSTAAPSWALNLSKMSGDNVNPVWRMVITQSRIANPNADLLTAGAPNSLATHPDTTTFEPSTDPAAAGQPWQQMNLFNAGLNVPIERVVWLGSTPPPTAMRASLTPTWSPTPGAQIYYNRTGSVYVPPGSYAVIGPRTTTYVGSAGTYNAPAGTNAKQWGIPSQQKISLASPITVTDINGKSTISAAAPTALKGSPYAAVGMVCAADPPPPAVWSNGAAYAAQSASTTGIGLSISEPLPAGGTPAGSAYYPQPTVAHSSAAGNLLLAGVYDAYDDLTQTTQSAQKYLDQPLEEIGSSVKYPTLVDPLLVDNISKTGTTQNYRTVFLQRLADPTSGYDALRNPYITVDWMPIDLTVFNGEDTATNPNDPNATNPLASVLFATRQRGGSNPQALPPLTYNLWTPVQTGDAPGNLATQPTSTKNANFAVTLGHTLGYLNQAYGTGLLPAAAIAGQYIGDPAQPFPWIAWNARPYASPMELLNVPASSPDRLLFEFNSPGTPVTYGTAATQLPPAGYNPYTPASAPGTPNPNARAPFGHLLNFFNSATSSYATGTSSNFYRVLEYLQVPSRFVGTETFLNPTYFAANGSGGAATQYFLPPFNTVSNYRDPGKVNINTVTDAGVWGSVLNGEQYPTFAQVCDSRRGDGLTTGTVIPPPPPPPSPPPSPLLPTYFGNAFRSAAGADLVPVPTMMHSGVNVTLLRAGGSTPDTATVPLFGANTSTAAYNNTLRNSYFAYQGLERVSNLVTTRSNVFGVWLTIGYFEVAAAPNGADAGHPDGYQLGEEIGSDTGEVERHRAFYIFDRSIPVGYERGQNHNVNRAILLKRYIE